jgi:hypothetical protein
VYPNKGNNKKYYSNNKKKKDPQMMASFSELFMFGSGPKETACLTFGIFLSCLSGLFVPVSALVFSQVFNTLGALAGKMLLWTTSNPWHLPLWHLELQRYRNERASQYVMSRKRRYGEPSLRVRRVLNTCV